MTTKKENKSDEKTKENVAYMTLINLKNILDDPQELTERQLHPKTCKDISGLISDMMKHGGSSINGIKTIDGMVMYPCAKHDYSPISECMKETDTGERCPYFDGYNINGRCVCKEERLVGKYKKYTYIEALKKEEQYRQSGMPRKNDEENKSKKSKKNKREIDEW